MPRLPDKNSLTVRTDFSTPQAHIADVSGISRGLGAIGGALHAEGKAMANDEKGLDLIRADADFDTRLRAEKRAFENDPDHATYETRFGAASNQHMMDAAKTIRDPKLREKWILDRATMKRNAAVDGVLARGRQRAVQEKEVEVEDILQRHQGAYGETTDPQERARILADMDAAVKVGQATGLLMPRTAERMRDRFIDGSLVIDAEGRINQGDAEGVLRDLGMIPGGVRREKPVPLVAQSSELGRVSAKYESGGRGVGFVSGGEGDPGGPSYGVHQLSSKDSMPAFLRSKEGQPYAAKLAGLMPGTARFNQVYKQVTAEDPEAMAAAQKAYYTRTHYEPLLDAAKERGFAVDDRGVQEALFSMAIQHGGAKVIVDRASSAAGMEPRDQIKALYAQRRDYVASLSSLPGRTKQSVLNRYDREEKDALALVGTKSKAAEPGAPRGIDSETGEPSGEGDDDGLGLIPWGEATEIDVTDPRRAQYQMMTGARRQALIHKAKTALSAKTQQDLASDIARIEDGQDEIADERGETAFQRASRILTPNQMEKFAQRRDMAVLTRDSIRVLKHMPEDRIPEHLSRIGEGMPPEAYGQVKKVRERAEREWAKIEEVRRKDPAAAVAAHPIVAQRVERMKNAGSTGVSIGENGDPVIDIRGMTPEQAQMTARELVDAALQAQTELGIPTSMQRTISKRQAQRLINLPNPQPANEKETRKLLEAAAHRAAAVYGPDVGERVFKDALALTVRGGSEQMQQYDRWGRRAIEDDRSSEVRAQLVAKQMFGGKVTEADLKRVQELDRLSASPPLIPGDGMDASRPFIGQPYQMPQTGMRQPSPGHVDVLLKQIAAKPKQAVEFRERFDARFGEGAAARALKSMIQPEEPLSP